MYPIFILSPKKNQKIGVELQVTTFPKRNKNRHGVFKVSLSLFFFATTVGPYICTIKNMQGMKFLSEILSARLYGYWGPGRLGSSDLI